MKESTGTFTYAATPGSYLAIVSVFCFMVPLETGVLALLLQGLVANGAVKLALFVTLGVFVLFILAKLCMPLWTKHHVDETSLLLRYGIDFKASIPRAAIVSAQPAREKVTIPSARYEAKSHHVVIAFSDKGQVLLRLDRAYPFRVGLFDGGLADQVLLSVDQRDAFLAALGFPAASVLASHETAQAPQEAASKSGSSEIRALSSFVPARQSPEPAALAIRVEGLTRRYADFTAVNNLNLAVSYGEIYGFLGANGAGKTTTMKMLVGLLEPGAGRVWIAGHDMWREPLAAKAGLGYVADRALLYERLTGREFLAFLAQVRGMPQHEAGERIAILLDLLELSPQADQLCGTYSYGMKRKVALAGALLHRPAVLILDEPLNGLDPLSARRLKDLLAELAARGTAIFLSTHDLATAEAVCHRVGIIHQGRLLIEGRTQELRQAATAPDLETVFLNLVAEQQQEVAL
ncbi:MAG: ABC transporter ATP-binding protein [Ktedonobacteraceae bacterium]|nr:ABC transporter ATP-binding protein [Ktedonobacteraceae bacterium]